MFSCEQIEKWKNRSLSEFDSKYFDWSDYATGLKEWLRHYPREQLLVLEAEQMFEDPQKVVNQVCEFLGLAIFALPTTKAFNSGGVKLGDIGALKNSFSSAHNKLRSLGVEMRWML